jgi:hypothetical protein
MVEFSFGDLQLKSVISLALSTSLAGLPLITTLASKLESGRVRPVFGLAGAERRADQALAARLLPEPAADSQARSVV